jgi:hypothetical protein
VRIHATLDAGDLNGEVRDTWVAKERVRDVYGTDDPEQAATRLDAAIAWCTEPESGPELRRLAKMLRRWMMQILNHYRTGCASSSPAVDARARLTPSRAFVLAVPGWSPRAPYGWLRPISS